MKQIILHKIPVWIYDRTITPAGKQLIDQHLSASGGVIQLHYRGEITVPKIMEFIDAVRANHLTILFVHAYPAQENTLTAYVKES